MRFSFTNGWTLASSGADRLPKTVYVRLTGSGIDATQTSTGDVVGDLTRSSSRAGEGKRKARWILRVRAEDEISGLGELQTARRRGGEYSSQPLHTPTAVSNPGRVRFVRIVDNAGNADEPAGVKRPRR